MTEEATQVEKAPEQAAPSTEGMTQADYMAARLAEITGKASPPGTAEGQEEKQAQDKQEKSKDDEQEEKKSEGDDSRASQAKESDTGEGGEPPSKSPQDDDAPKASGGELPKGMKARLARQERKHQRELEAVKLSFESRIAELESRLSTKETGTTPPVDGKSAKEQYESLGIDAELGPDMGDYSDQIKWAEDYVLWGQEEPLQHHPKLNGKGSDAPKGSETQKGSPPDKQMTAEELRAVQYQEEVNALWSELESTYEALEESDDSELSTDDYEKFMASIQANKVRVDLEMLEHIVDSDDGPEIIELLMQQPVKSFRVYAKAAGEKGKALDAMLSRARKASAKADAKGKPEDDKILPPIKGGSSTGGRERKMTQAEYVAARRAEMQSQMGVGRFGI